MEFFNVQIRLHKGDRGQATVEFALLLPLVALCLSAILSATWIGLSSLSLADTARNAARIASTAEDPSSAVEEALHDSHLKHVESLDDSQQFLTVSLTQHLRVPILGITLPKMTLTASSTILLETPPVLFSDSTPQE